MGKTHRGSNLRGEQPRAGRGTCPITRKTGVKLLYEHEIDGKKVMISKSAKATLANARRRQAKKEKKQEAVAE
ncbi:MAG: hypothetical protein EA384_06520 [Spirochaetaceae bacterium]|nr:MAG: hypothetical protein EA384_06520 [Spirochaetaceae bacterium]